MKKRYCLSKSIFIAFIIFMLMFAVNTAVMKIFFQINVFDLRYAKAALLKSARNNNDQRQLDVTAGSEGVQEKDRQIFVNNNRENGAVAASGEDTGPACADGFGQVFTDGTGLAEHTDSIDESGYYIFPEEVEMLKHLSLQDKLLALSIISRIDSDVKDRVYEMSQDGVTYSELAEIKESVEKYLLPDEMKSLEEILLKNKAAYTGNGK